MFVYCYNNPLTYIDANGYLAYPGEIHNQVVKYVAALHGLYKEQRINYNFGYGRADLISSDGQVWDVKRDKETQIKAGKKQVAKYVRNTWANNPKQKLRVGGYISSGSFSYTSGSITYKITYRYAGDGVIAYDYKVTDFDVTSVSVTCAVLLAGATAGAISTLLPTTGKNKVSVY